MQLDNQREPYNKLSTGMRIRQAREDAGFTQLSLALEIGVSEVQISRIENGNSGCKLETIIKISDCTGASVDYLLGRDTLISDKISERGKLLQEINKLFEKASIKELTKAKTVLSTLLE